MERMAEAFNTSVTALEDELMQLILDGQIQARIDSHSKVLSIKFNLTWMLLAFFLKKSIKIRCKTFKKFF